VLINEVAHGIESLNALLPEPDRLPSPQLQQIMATTEDALSGRRKSSAGGALPATGRVLPADEMRVVDRK